MQCQSLWLKEKLLTQKSLRCANFSVKTTKVWHSWHNSTPIIVSKVHFWISSGESVAGGWKMFLNENSWTWWNSKILILHHSRPKLFSLIRFTKICIQCWNVHYRVILHRIAQYLPPIQFVIQLDLRPWISWTSRCYYHSRMRCCLCQNRLIRLAKMNEIRVKNRFI